MDLYLPIAHMDINIAMIVGFGLIVGFLSGLTGVGGGFLITPLLIFVGVPPLIAVGTGAAQIVGASAVGSYAHWRLGNVDMRMAIVLLIGSWTGGCWGCMSQKFSNAADISDWLFPSSTWDSWASSVFPC